MTVLETVVTALVLLGVVTAIVLLDRSRATRIETDRRHRATLRGGTRRPGRRRGRPGDEQR